MYQMTSREMHIKWSVILVWRMQRIVIGNCSSSHPQHVKNAIPCSQFLRLRSLYSVDSDLNRASEREEMCQFFRKRGFPGSAGCHHRQTSSPRNRSRNRSTNVTERWSQHSSIQLNPSFTKPGSQNIILKTFKILCNDPENKYIFPLPPLISFKCEKNIGNFLVRSEFFWQPTGNFQMCTRCKTCPFISNMVKISGPNRSAKITLKKVAILHCLTCNWSELYSRVYKTAQFFVIFGDKSLILIIPENG